MTTPEFSIITPTYNCGRFALRCYWSLCQQTIPNWEWIIMDDGSTDGTEDLIRGLADTRIRYFRMDRRGGPGAARNRAMVEARAAWFVMQDMDDLSFPSRLERARKARASGFDYMSSRLALIDDHYHIIGVRGTVTERYPVSFPHATLCGQAAMLRSIGYPEFQSGEDQTMVLRLANNQCGLHLPVSLYIYHENASLSLAKARTANRHMFQQLRQLRKEGYLKGSVGLYRTMGQCALKVALLTLMSPFGTKGYAMTLRRRERLQGEGVLGLEDVERAYIQQTAARFPQESQRP